MAIRSLNEGILDEAIRHAVSIEGFKNGEVRRMVNLLERDLMPEVKANLRRRLEQIKIRGMDVGPWTTKKIRAMNGAIVKETKSMIRLAREELRASLYNLSLTEGEWARAVAGRVAGVNLDFNTPSPQMLKSIVTSRPMAGKLLREDWLDLEVSTRKRLSKQLQIGIATGEGTDRIARRWARELKTTTKKAAVLTRTAVTHVTVHAREATWEANKDMVKGVQWVSTLDRRTSDACKSLDGKVFKIGKGPRPPAHHQCRSTTVPVLKTWEEFKGTAKKAVKGLPKETRASMRGQIPSKVSYGDWFARQGMKAQRQILGKGRFELYKNGQLDVTKMVTKDLKPLTLAQLRKRAGLNALGVPIEEQFAPLTPYIPKEIPESSVYKTKWTGDADNGKFGFGAPPEEFTNTPKGWHFGKGWKKAIAPNGSDVYINPDGTAFKSLIAAKYNQKNWYIAKNPSSPWAQMPQSDSSVPGTIGHKAPIAPAAPPPSLGATKWPSNVHSDPEPFQIFQDLKVDKLTAPAGHDAWKDGLSHREGTIIRDWVAGDQGAIRRDVRGGVMQDALLRSPMRPPDSILYRGMNLTQEQIDEFKVGGEFTFNAMASSSKKYQIAVDNFSMGVPNYASNERGVILKIHSRSGGDIKHVATTHVSEQEVVLLNGTRCEILKVYESGGGLSQRRLIVEMRETADSPALLSKLKTHGLGPSSVPSKPGIAGFVPSTPGSLKSATVSTTAKIDDSLKLKLTTSLGELTEFTSPLTQKYAMLVDQALLENKYDDAINYLGSVISELKYVNLKSIANKVIDLRAELSLAVKAMPKVATIPQTGSSFAALGDGWTMAKKTTTAGKGYKVYTAPDGKNFQSKVKAAKYAETIAPLPPAPPPAPIPIAPAPPVLPPGGKAPDLPDGWGLETKVTSKGKKYKVYTSPEGKSYYSMVKVKEAVKAALPTPPPTPVVARIKPSGIVVSDDMRADWVTKFGDVTENLAGDWEPQLAKIDDLLASGHGDDAILAIKNLANDLKAVGWGQIVDNVEEIGKLVADDLAKLKLPPTKVARAAVTKALTPKSLIDEFQAIAEQGYVGDALDHAAKLIHKSQFTKAADRVDILIGKIYSPGTQPKTAYVSALEKYKAKLLAQAKLSPIDAWDQAALAGVNKLERDQIAALIAKGKMSKALGRIDDVIADMEALHKKAVAQGYGDVASDPAAKLKALRAKIAAQTKLAPPKLKLGAGVPAGGAPTPITPKPMPKASPFEEAGAWNKTGGQKGSNVGGTYQDDSGTYWYVKEAKTANHAADEALANRLYRELGIDVPEVKRVTLDGKAGVASRWSEGLEQVTSSKLAASNAHEGFAADAWLGNWDVVGLSNDNLLLKGGKVVRLDTGGALRYRAMGASKGAAWGDDVAELKSMRDAAKNPKSASVFKGMTDRQVAESIERLEGITEQRIRDIVATYGPDSAHDAGQMAARLIARRKYILARKPKLAPDAAAKVATKMAPEPKLVGGIIHTDGGGDMPGWEWKLAGKPGKEYKIYLDPEGKKFTSLKKARAAFDAKAPSIPPAATAPTELAAVGKEIDAQALGALLKQGGGPLGISVSDVSNLNALSKAGKYADLREALLKLTKDMPVGAARMKLESLGYTLDDLLKKAKLVKPVAKLAGAKIPADGKQIGALPDGWYLKQHETGKGQKYKTYHAPDGKQFSSLKKLIAHHDDHVGDQAALFMAQPKPTVALSTPSKVSTKHPEKIAPDGWKYKNEILVDDSTGLPEGWKIIPNEAQDYVLVESPNGKTFFGLDEARAAAGLNKMPSTKAEEFLLNRHTTKWKGDLDSLQALLIEDPFPAAWQQKIIDDSQKAAKELGEKITASGKKRVALFQDHLKAKKSGNMLKADKLLEAMKLEKTASLSLSEDLAQLHKTIISHKTHGGIISQETIAKRRIDGLKALMGADPDKATRSFSLEFVAQGNAAKIFAKGTDAREAFDDVKDWLEKVISKQAALDKKRKIRLTFSDKNRFSYFDNSPGSNTAGGQWAKHSTAKDPTTPINSGPIHNQIKVGRVNKTTGKIYGDETAKAKWRKSLIHEYGHELEHTTDGARDLVQAFQKRRIMQSGKPNIDMDKWGMPGEMGNEDDFRKAFDAFRGHKNMGWVDSEFDVSSSAAYAGKVYSSGSTELVSMGLEMLYTDPALFAKVDPEWCELILRVIRGECRTVTKLSTW
jgi:SPP1 gp7 family putative phage head morphogenesis protein